MICSAMKVYIQMRCGGGVGNDEIMEKGWSAFKSKWGPGQDVEHRLWNWILINCECLFEMNSLCEIMNCVRCRFKETRRGGKFCHLNSSFLWIVRTSVRMGSQPIEWKWNWLVEQYADDKGNDDDYASGEWRRRRRKRPRRKFNLFRKRGPINKRAGEEQKMNCWGRRWYIGDHNSNSS